jgi:hypothetical protein
MFLTEAIRYYNVMSALKTRLVHTLDHVEWR